MMLPGRQNFLVCEEANCDLKKVRRPVSSTREARTYAMPRVPRDSNIPKTKEHSLNHVKDPTISVFLNSGILESLGSGTCAAQEEKVEGIRGLVQTSQRRDPEKTHVSWG